MNKKLLLSIALGMQLTIGYAQGFKNPVLDSMLTRVYVGRVMTFIW